MHIDIYCNSSLTLGNVTYCFGTRVRGSPQGGTSRALPDLRSCRPLPTDKNASGRVAKQLRTSIIMAKPGRVHCLIKVYLSFSLASPIKVHTPSAHPFIRMHWLITKPNNGTELAIYLMMQAMFGKDEKDTASKLGKM